MRTTPGLMLAVDTAGADAGLALAGDGFVDTALLPVRGGFSATEDLSDQARTLLGGRSRTAADVALIAAVVGPGSYTGLRSGLAFVRGLAFAGSLPAVAVGTLELLVWRGVRAGESAVAATPGGQGRWILAAYHREEAEVRELAAPQMAEEPELAARLAEPGCAVLLVAESASTDTLAAAARAGALELRTLAGDSLAALVALASARASRSATLRAADVLPIYVGQSPARPNRDRVAILGSAE